MPKTNADLDVPVISEMAGSPQEADPINGHHTRSW